MSLLKKMFIIMFVVSLTAGIYGCKKEGPAERAGKSIDNALEQAKDKLDDAASK
jgi:hypothetical protein